MLLFSKASRKIWNLALGAAVLSSASILSACDDCNGTSLCEESSPSASPTSPTPSAASAGSCKYSVTLESRTVRSKIIEFESKCVSRVNLITMVACERIPGFNDSTSSKYFAQLSVSKEGAMKAIEEYCDELADKVLDWDKVSTFELSTTCTEFRTNPVPTSPCRLAGQDPSPGSGSSGSGTNTSGGGLTANADRTPEQNEAVIRKANQLAHVVLDNTYPEDSDLVQSILDQIEKGMKEGNWD